MSESIKYKKFKKVIIPLYRQVLYIGIGPDILAKKFKVPGLEIAPTHAGVTTFIEDEEGMRAFCVSFAEIPDSEELAHEALHAAWYILEEVGVDVSADNHEALAYLTGYIAGQIESMLI
jgi:hypothetical protein